MPNQKLPPKQMIDAVREVLLRKWDPIGIQDEPLAQDEYDSYVLVVCRLIIENRGKAVIADHLHQLVTVNMGLTGNYNHCLTVADALVKLNAVPST